MESIGGYRIIRRLGSGTRADVFLGHAEHQEEADERLAAIKLFRTDAGVASIDAEIAALSSLDSPHIVRLRDLASGADGKPCLILQRLEPGGLSRLLAQRESLTAGEAVTILAPIAGAVGSMHRRGIVHGKLNASAVLFDDVGAPVLTGFGAAGFVDANGRDITPAELEAHAGVSHDLDSLSLLVESVVGRVGGRGPATGEFLRRLRNYRGGATDFAEELEEQLFALADPLSIRFAAESPPQRAVPRWRIAELPAEDQAAGVGVAVPAASRGSAVEWAGPLRPLIQLLRVQAVDAVRPLLARVLAGTSSVRKRVWVVAGLGGVAIIVAVFIPWGSTGHQISPPATESAAPAERASSVSAVMGDDPLSAAEQLLATRAVCLRDRSVLCLDEVDLPGSAAWEADAARIRDVQHGAELTPDSLGTGAVPMLIERLGGSALVALVPADSGGAEISGAATGATAANATATNATASILMIRTEAGWRFRSLLGDQARDVG